MKIEIATTQHIPSIQRLLMLNHVDNVVDKSAGYLSVSMTDQELTELIEDSQAIQVAVEDDEVCGLVMAGPWEIWERWPMLKYMGNILNQYHIDGIKLDTATTYLYGPICIDPAYRGRGLFQELFGASREQWETRYDGVVTFISKTNPRSYAAHTKKAGMREVGTFEFNNKEFYMMVRMFHN